MPTLPPPFLLPLIFIFSLALAQTDFPLVPLPLDENVATINRSIPLNDGVTFIIDLPQVDPPTNATLLLEWSTTNIVAFPSTLFFLSNSADSPIRTSGLSTQYNSRLQKYTCSSRRPCATVNTVDWMAFFTRATRSFLRSPVNQTSRQTVYATVYNYNITKGDDIISSPPSPTNLTGVLSARLETEPSKDCPGSILPTDPVCTAQGKCHDTRCQCNEDDIMGVACDQKIVRLPSVNNPPNEPFLVEPQPNSYTVRVNLFSNAVFTAKHEAQNESIVFEIRMLRGFTDNSNLNASVDAPRVVLFLSQLENPFMHYNATSPTLGRNFTFFNKTNRISRRYTSVPEKANQLVYLVVHAFPRDENMRDGYALVNINVTTCLTSECDGSSRGNAIELALIPAFLVTTAVASIGILVMLYLDRRHRFTSSVDRLSPGEIERMYPNMEFSGETYECPICLCEMENRDVVRTLKCTHVFHSECLDPWLTGNRASCPTCRTEVRIENLSDKRSMRRMVRVLLAPITAIRRFRERRQGREREEDPPRDVEPGNTAQTDTPELNEETNDNNGARDNMESGAS